MAPNDDKREAARTQDDDTFRIMTLIEWNDRGSDEEETRADRATLMRRVPYEVLIDLDRAWEDQTGAHHRAALTLNVGHGGMLVLMDKAVHVGVPVILDVAPLRPVCPTASPLAEVAWTHPVPFASSTLHFVGLKFLR
jgi:hypothetical protein